MQCLILNTNYKPVKMEVKSVVSGIHFKRIYRDKMGFLITILYLWIVSYTHVIALCTLYCIHTLYFSSLKMTMWMVETFCI
jgi:hypothetical protein